MTLLLVLFLQSASSALPAQSDTAPRASSPKPIPQSAIFNLQSEMSLGDSLLKHGFNLEAGREFRRVLWENREQSLGAPASDVLGAPSERAARGIPRFPAGLTHLKLGLSLAAASQLQLAAEELRTAGRITPELAEPAQTALAGYYTRSKRYDLATFELSDLLVFTRDSVRRATLNSALGWLRLQEGDVASAASSYDLAGKPDVASALRFAKAAPYRSPTIAAVLSSFVPGSGEAYAGRPASGLLAFAVTAGSLVWAVTAAKSDDLVSASVIVSSLFWRFYNGSRANAAAFADEYNSAARHRRIASLTPQVAEPDWFGGMDSLIGYKVRPDTEADGGTR